MIHVLHQGDNRYEIYRKGQNIGCIAVWENPSHAGHAYLNPGLTEYDPTCAADLFEQLLSLLNKPLQVMTYSDNHTLCDFLTAGGFVCKRRCYEMEATADDLIRPVSNIISLAFHTKGEEAYEAACQLLYDYYKGKHADINPLTMDYNTFCAHLPETVCSSENMHHIAFLEEDEIAYVASDTPEKISDFLESLLSDRLRRWGRVCFECDDCDRIAMQLLSYFTNPRVSWDTYILLR